MENMRHQLKDFRRQLTSRESQADEQLKASRNQLTIREAQADEQLKASEARADEQLKAVRSEMASELGSQEALAERQLKELRKQLGNKEAEVKELGREVLRGRNEEKRRRHEAAEAVLGRVTEELREEQGGGAGLRQQLERIQEELAERARDEKGREELAARLELAREELTAAKGELRESAVTMTQVRSLRTQLKWQSDAGSLAVELIEEQGKTASLEAQLADAQEALRRQERELREAADAQAAVAGTWEPLVEKLRAQARRDELGAKELGRQLLAATARLKKAEAAQARGATEAEATESRLRALSPEGRSSPEPAARALGRWEPAPGSPRDRRPASPVFALGASGVPEASRARPSWPPLDSAAVGSEALLGSQESPGSELWRQRDALLAVMKAEDRPAPGSWRSTPRPSRSPSPLAGAPPRGSSAAPPAGAPLRGSLLLRRRRRSPSPGSPPRPAQSPRSGRSRYQRPLSCGRRPCCVDPSTGGVLCSCLCLSERFRRFQDGT